MMHQFVKTMIKIHLLKRTLLQLAALGFLSLGIYTAASAQPGQGQTADKIIAVVGREIVLQSDIDAQIALLQQQNPRLNPRDPAIRERVLDALINEKLIVTKAIEDSITVTEEEVTQRLDYTIQNLIQQFGSEKRVEEVYQHSIAWIRREFREEIRKQALSEKLRQQKFGDLKASQREVEEFYAMYRDSLPPTPAQVELFHIVKNVQATNSAKENALNLARRIRDSIMNGGDFADFARRNSADPGSATAGGDLGWFDKGKLMPEYEKAAYSLTQNEISQPVETPFGFHIIQLIDKRKDAVNTRHILLKVGQSGDDMQRAQDSLLDFKRRVENGESFEALAKQYSDDQQTRAFGGSLGKIEITRLPPDLKSKIEALPDGGMTDIMPYNGDPTKTAFHIMYKKGVIPEHKTTLESDFKRIEQVATVYKQNKMYEEWMASLRKSMYWEVKK
ncbi:MAG TPA: peptidylprolyl isomerase [Patescibacteria group bacterium]|nr:peptidylprolyl isomerase [Patescibacteria group bacterium]